MNTFLKLKAALATLLFTLLLLFTSVTQAQQYNPTTVWSMTSGTNTAAGGTTNIGATSTGAITLTKYDQFALQFTFIGTNSAAAAGTMDVQWDTSLDGSNWAIVGKPGSGTGAAGWFGIPVTNSLTTVWITNITVNSVGYFRINWITNQSGVCLTNANIKVALKPKRTG